MATGQIVTDSPLGSWTGSVVEGSVGVTFYSGGTMNQTQADDFRDSWYLNYAMLEAMFERRHADDLKVKELTIFNCPGCASTYASATADVNILGGATAVLAGGIPAAEGGAVVVSGSVDAVNNAVFWAEAHGVPATSVVIWLQQQSGKGTQPSVFTAVPYWFNHF